MRLYIGNLSYHLNEEQLREPFETFGEVVSVSLVNDRGTGQPRGFGFVEMADRAAAEAAIAELNGTDLAGRAMRIDRARPSKTYRKKKPSSTLRLSVAERR